MGGAGRGPAAVPAHVPPPFLFISSSSSSPNPKRMYSDQRPEIFSFMRTLASHAPLSLFHDARWRAREQYCAEWQRLQRAKPSVFPQP